MAACRAGYSVYFTTLDGMVRQLKAADVIGLYRFKTRYVVLELGFLLPCYAALRYFVDQSA